LIAAALILPSRHLSIPTLRFLFGMSLVLRSRLATIPTLGRLVLPIHLLTILVHSIGGPRLILAVLLCAPLMLRLALVLGNDGQRSKYEQNAKSTHDGKSGHANLSSCPYRLSLRAVNQMPW
jgi:hypothetical protein